MHLPKYSIGVGDRFAHQGVAQLDAVILAANKGVSIAPVWNKSHREHTLVGSRPADVRAEADAAVRARQWSEPYFVDADHINLKIVDRFLEASDFFTLDVADVIGVEADAAAIADFVGRHENLVGRLSIPGMEHPLEISRPMMTAAAAKFLAAVAEAGRIYRRIAESKGDQSPVIELSMDETDQPQTPAELLLILAAVADEGIPAETIAPRFTGRFNKGVDYVGSVSKFTQEFEDDLAVLAFAVREFGLQENIKLSVHSGSDKFSIYPSMHQLLKKHNAGVHLKTAGTTWLEELIGLAAAGGEGLAIVKDVYATAYPRIDQLCAPYASVIDIDRAALPSPEVVHRWNSVELASALRHDQSCAAFNPNLRQLMHVGYLVAAEMGKRYIGGLEKYADIIAENVTANLFQRHIQPLFLGE
jgi:tagaturonate epimerase